MAIGVQCLALKISNKTVKTYLDSIFNNNNNNNDNNDNNSNNNNNNNILTGKHRSPKLLVRI